MGMAQVIATIAYGIRGLRRGKTTWSWPDFNPDPVQENLAQLSRWSLNAAPTWEFPPLAIANQYYDQQGDEVKRARYRLLLVRGLDLRWLNRERLQEVHTGNMLGNMLNDLAEAIRRWTEEKKEVQTGLGSHHKWLPEQDLLFTEVVLYAYAAESRQTFIGRTI